MYRGQLFSRRIARIRGAISDEQYSDAKIGLDEVAMRILKVTEGDKVWLRDPNWSVEYVIKKEGKELYEKNGD